MIRVYIPETASTLDLGDAKVTLELINPLFEDEFGASSHSFKFDIPNNAHNRKALRYADLPSAGVASTSSYFLLAGHEFAKTKLLVAGANEQKFSISLEMGRNRLASTLGEMKLAELGGLQHRTISSTQNIQQRNDEMTAHADSLVGGAGDYVFFPYANAFQYANNSPFPANNSEHYTNFYMNGRFYMPEQLATIEGIGPTYSSMSPSFFLNYVLKQIGQEDGISYKAGDWGGNSEIGQLAILNNFNLDEAVYTYSAFGGSPSAFVQRGEIRDSEHMPEAQATEFLNALLTLFNLGYVEGRGEFELVSRQYAIEGKEQVDWRDFCSSYALKPSINPNLGYTFYSEPDENDQIFIASPLKDDPELDISQTVADEGLIQEPGAPHTLARSIYENQLFAFDRDGYYDFFSVDHYPVVHLGGKKKRESIITAPAAKLTANRYGVAPTWDVPHFAFVTDSPYNGRLNPTRVRPHLVFYRGLQQRNAITFPLATADAENFSYSLRWHGPDGLYEKWHRPWLEMAERSIPASYELDLPIHEVFAIDWCKRHRLRVREGEVRAWLKKLRVEINADSMRPKVKADVLIEK